MRAFVLALFGMILLSGGAPAQTASENGRYSMTPTQGGFLRLDTRTGEVALCRPWGESVECRSAGAPGARSRDRSPGQREYGSEGAPCGSGNGDRRRAAFVAS